MLCSMFINSTPVHLLNFKPARLWTHWKCQGWNLCYNEWPSYCSIHSFNIYIYPAFMKLSGALLFWIPTLFVERKQIKILCKWTRASFSWHLCFQTVMHIAYFKSLMLSWPRSGLSICPPSWRGYLRLRWKERKKKKRKKKPS